MLVLLVLVMATSLAGKPNCTHLSSSLHCTSHSWTSLHCSLPTPPCPAPATPRLSVNHHR